MNKDGFPWPDGSECPVCGKNTLIITDDPIADDIEGETYYATGFKYNRCTACGEEFLRMWMHDEISKQLHAHAREALDRLSGEDIRSLRIGHGLTQRQLEERLGVSQGLVGRWERGTVIQSPMADRYLRDLMAHPELVDEHGAVAREGRGPYRAKRE